MMREKRGIAEKWGMRLFLISHFSFLIFFAACTQDTYEKGEGALSAMVAEMGDGYTASDKKVTRFVTDDGAAFSVSNPFSSSLMPKADTVYRAIFYYVKDGEKAEVKGLNKVLVVSPHQVKDMKTDPVRFESAWVGKSKSYLNLSVYLMQGYTEDEEAVHKIGFRRDSLYQNADGTKTLRLTLYHDQAGMPEYYSQRFYLSVPLQSFGVDSVWLDVNTYNGWVEKRIKL